jgi:hypothetical protein
MRPDPILRFFMSACLATLVPAVASAQRPADAAETIPVTVAMPPSSAESRQEILITRYAADGYRIVLPRDLATPANLRAAMVRIVELAARDGSATRDNEVFRIMPDDGPPPIGGYPGTQKLIDQLVRDAEHGRGSPRRESSIRIRLFGPDPRAKMDDRLRAASGSAPPPQRR